MPVRRLWAESAMPWLIPMDAHSSSSFTRPTCRIAMERCRCSSNRDHATRLSNALSPTAPTAARASPKPPPSRSRSSANSPIRPISSSIPGAGSSNDLRMGEPEPPPLQRLRAHHPLRYRVPLRRSGARPRQTTGSLRMRFKTGSQLTGGIVRKMPFRSRSLRGEVAVRRMQALTARPSRTQFPPPAGQAL